MKTPIVIQGIKYTSLAEAARTLVISKSALYRALKNNENLDREKITNLQASFGNKSASREITVAGITYGSLREAARATELHPAAFRKAANGKSEIDEKLLAKLKKRTKGYHLKSVKVNGVFYSSLKEAGRAFDVTERAVAHWIKVQGTVDLKVDINKLAFDRIDKGSLKHMRLLAHAAGFKTLQDWETRQRKSSNLVTFSTWIRNSWEGDLLLYLEKEYPNQNIKWWKMPRTPSGLWQNPERLKQYLDWLGTNLGYTKTEDWYKVTVKDFQNNFGGSIQVYYTSVTDVLETCFPTFEWLPWLFRVAPNGCWKNKKNHKKFLNFVAKEENFVAPEDWYSATRALFTKHKGASLLKYYDSIFSCINSNFPEYNLRFWLMKKSRGNWERKENQLEYMQWLGEKLCFAKPEDWYHAIENDFINNDGVTLIGQDYYGSVANCIMSVFKEHDWEEALFRGKNHWKMQLRMYAISSCAFPEWDVERELSLQTLTSEELESGQRVDVFINRPLDNHSLVLEYNGRQHYEHVDHFHKTREEFEEAKNRDIIKRAILKQTSIPFIDIKYSDWDGSVTYILKILNEHFECNVKVEDVFEQAKLRGLYEPVFLDTEPNTNSRAARQPKPILPLEDILNYADQWFKDYGAWPKKRSGPIAEGSCLTWNDINNQLRKQNKSSLANMLLEERGVRHHLSRKNLSVEQLISWAKDHHKKTGTWPTYNSGEVLAARSEDWGAIRSNLVSGGRGLPSGLSIEKVLFNELGIVGVRSGKNLTEDLVIKLAKAHFGLTGFYPNENSEWVLDGEDSWVAISAALRDGSRGLKGGTSLAQILDKSGLKANFLDRSYPSLEEIKKAAEEFRDRKKKLPTKESGSFPDYLNLTWGAVNGALKRGAIVGVEPNSLADLFVKELGYRNVNSLPDLSEEQILNWCDIFKNRTGKFPSNTSQNIQEMGTETFMSIETAIREDRRGLLGYGSLANLLVEKRGHRSNKNLPNLTVQIVTEWMIDWHNETGKWPTSTDGAIPNSGGEKWSNINAVMHRGGRGITKTSLAKLKKDILANPPKI